MTTVTAETLRDMSISQIAGLVAFNWNATSKNGVNYGAKPYLEAMFSMENIKDFFGLDPGEQIVLYFLSNATTWRGPVAKLVKLELKRRLRTECGYSI